MTVPVFLLASVAVWFAVAYYLEQRAHQKTRRTLCLRESFLGDALAALRVADDALVDVAHERLIERVSWYMPVDADEALRDWTRGDAA